MRVEIANVETSAQDVRVEVATAVGQFWAQWSGDSPNVGDTLEVEMTLDDMFTWGGDIEAVEPRDHAISQGEHGGVVIYATLEQCEDDGFAGLRVGKSIVMLEADGDPASVGDTVRVDASSIALSDTGI